jgi:hypothetical protein
VDSIVERLVLLGDPEQAMLRRRRTRRIPSPALWILWHPAGLFGPSENNPSARPAARWLPAHSHTERDGPRVPFGWLRCVSVGTASSRFRWRRRPARVLVVDRLQLDVALIDSRDTP